MKTLKIFGVCCILLATSYQVDAQFAKHALGIRASGHNDFGIGPEISYQYGFNDLNRGELDLGFRNSRHVDVVKFTALYHWVWNTEGGFNWFIGFGAGAGYVDYDPDGPRWNDPDYDDAESFLLSAAGDVGFEYIFPFPLQLALDVRPEFYIIENYYDNFEPNIGFSVRYQFR